jgi:hypothetical protein
MRRKRDRYIYESGKRQESMQHGWFLGRLIVIGSQASNRVCRETCSICRSPAELSTSVASFTKGCELKVCPAASQLNVDRFGSATPSWKAAAFQRLVHAQAEKPDRYWSAPQATASPRFQQREGTMSRGLKTLLDCPISGTPQMVSAGKAAIFASGDENTVESNRSMLESIAPSINYVGKLGAGSTVKFATNALVAIHTWAAAEAFVLA